MRHLFMGLVTCLLIYESWSMLNYTEDSMKLLRCFEGNGTYQQYTDPECVKYFMESTLALKRNYNFTDHQINYLRSLDRQVRTSLLNTHRRKRQTMQLRVRQDCRTLSDEQRTNLFEAFNRLKFDNPIPGQDSYDTLAALHSPRATDLNAHGGSNFYSWHRVYLYYVEEALRRKVPGVTLCYWDSSCDFLMPGNAQIRTITFSHNMFGNGRGAIVSGPFAGWRQFGAPTQTVRRDIGRNGALARPGVVDLVSTDPSINIPEQITRGSIGYPDPDTGMRSSWEAEHDNVHVWVGGNMVDVPTATNDPVFFFHHTFIDYVWEEFRNKIRLLGINPERYPIAGGPQHGPNVPMEGLSAIHPWWINRNGYTELFRLNVYRYADSPRCNNNCGGGASQRYLYCPRIVQDNTRCIARVANSDIVSPRVAARFSAFTARATNSLEETGNIAEEIQRQEGPLVTGRTFVASVQDSRIQ